MSDRATSSNDPDRNLSIGRDALEAPENGVSFSQANIWEIAIKRVLGRPDFAFEPETIRSAALGVGFVELPIDGIHAARVRQLPPPHRDPFDRLLIAQAQVEPMTLVTNDPQIARYMLSLWHLQAAEYKDGSRRS